jgi:hypothetical protein
VAPVLVALASPAQAGTIATPSMFSGSLTEAVNCEAVNVGEKTIHSVTVRIVPAFAPLTGAEATCTDLAPGAVCVTSIAPPPAFFAGHCKVEFTGGKRSIRGAMSLIEAGDNVRAQLAAQ